MSRSLVPTALRLLMRRSHSGLLFCWIWVSGCAVGPAEAPDGPVAAEVFAASSAHGVPRDLVLAIARVEGGLLLPRLRAVRDDDDVPVGGILELRHGAFNSLARGAALLGTDEATLRHDTDLGTEAGILVLGELGARTGASAEDLASWRAAIEELSGIRDGRYRDEYVAEVFTTLRDGGDFPARDGETIHIAPHLEIGEDTLRIRREELGNPPPDFPGAIWFSTDCNNKCTAGRPDGDGSVNAIVIHDTEGGWAGSVATLQNDGGKSVHYLVDVDGSRVGQFLHEGDTAWHAGNWCWNTHSIGIEHVGVASDPSGYSVGLYDKSVELVKSIRSRWKSIPLDRAHIVGHYQIPNGNLIPECNAACSDTLTNCEKSADYGGSGNHRDPGYFWQWCQYFQKLGGHCECNDAWPLWNCTTDKTEAVRCKNGQVEIVDCQSCESQPNGMDDICHGAAPPKADMAAPDDLATTPHDLAMPRGEVDLALASVDANALSDGSGARSDGMAGGDGGAPTDGGKAQFQHGCHCDLGRSHPSRGGGAAPWMIAGCVLLALRRRARPHSPCRAENR